MRVGRFTFILITKNRINCLWSQLIWYVLDLLVVDNQRLFWRRVCEWDSCSLYFPRSLVLANNLSLIWEKYPLFSFVLVSNIHMSSHHIRLAIVDKVIVTSIPWIEDLISVSNYSFRPSSWWVLPLFFSDSSCLSLSSLSASYWSNISTLTHKYFTKFE